MYRSARAIALALAVALVGAAPATDRLFAAWNAPDSPGCVAGSQTAGRPASIGSYGMADLEHAIPLAPTTRFSVGSVSKPITALVIGTLVEDGTLALDRDVRPMLPELARYPEPITARELLTHTSGVRDFRQLLALAGWRPNDTILPSDVSRILGRQKTTSFRPGTEYVYSNSDFYLLAELASRALKEPFSRIARERVFAPLGMDASAFVDRFGQLVPDRAWGYDGEKGNWSIRNREDVIAGPSTLVTTVPDLLRFLLNFDAQTVGGPSYVAAMQEPGALAGGAPIDISNTGIGSAFGMTVVAFGSTRAIEHSGEVPGFSADVVWIPARRIALAIACNTSADASDVMRAFVGSVTGLALASDAPSVAGYGAFVAAVPGAYQHPSMRNIERISVSPAGATLGHHRLARLADGSYAVDDAPAARVAFRENGASPQLLLWNPGQTTPEIYAMRAPGGTAVALTDRELAQYGGPWISPELDSTWTFRPDAGRLALISAKWEADPEFFRPMLRDTFVGESGTIVEFYRDRAGTLAGFRATWDRARGIAFRRSTP